MNQGDLLTIEAWPGSFYVRCEETLPASTSATLRLGETSWVDRMRSARMQVKYKFVTQPMATVLSTPPTNLAAPAPITQSLRSLQPFAYQIIKSSDVAPTYNAVLVTCIVSLKRFVASNNTTANTWVDVVMNDPAVARKFTFRAVYELTFANRLDPADVAVLGVPVPPVVLTGAFSSVRDFVRIRDAIKELAPIAASGAVPAHALITPVEVKAIKDKFAINGAYFSFNIMGPSEKLYINLIESAMEALYKAENQVIAAPVGNYDITNRASIISLFTRYRVLVDDTKVSLPASLTSQPVIHSQSSRSLSSACSSPATHTTANATSEKPCKASSKPKSLPRSACSKSRTTAPHVPPNPASTTPSALKCISSRHGSPRTARPACRCCKRLPRASCKRLPTSSSARDRTCCFSATRTR